MNKLSLKTVYKPELKLLFDYDIIIEDVEQKYQILSDNTGHLFINEKNKKKSKRLGDFSVKYLLNEELFNKLNNYILNQMFNEYNFIGLSIPLINTSSISYQHYFTQYYLFIYRNYYNCDSLLLIIPDITSDSSICMWSYLMTIKTGLRYGTMLPYFEKAKKLGYGVGIINPNAQSDCEVNPKINILAVLSFVALKTKCKTIFILSCGNSILYLFLGGAYTKEVVDEISADILPRLSFIGFCNSTHTVTGEESVGILDFISNHSYQWISSSFFKSHKENIVSKFSKVPIDSSMHIYITNIINNNKNDVNETYTVLNDSGYIAAISIESIFQCFESSLKRSSSQSTISDTTPNISKEKIYACQNCGLYFNYLLPRHRCSVCKKVLCSNCTRYRIPLHYKAKCKRVCNNCYDKKTLITSTSSDKSILYYIIVPFFSFKIDEKNAISRNDLLYINNSDTILYPNLSETRITNDFPSPINTDEYSLVISEYSHISAYIVWFYNKMSRKKYPEIIKSLNSTITKLYNIIKKKTNKKKTYDWASIYLLCMRFVTEPIFKIIHLKAYLEFKDEESEIVSIKKFIKKYKPFLLKKILSVHKLLKNVDWSEQISTLSTLCEFVSMDYNIIILNKVIDDIVEKMRDNKIPTESMTVDTILPIFIYILCYSKLISLSLLFNSLWDILDPEYKLNNIGYNVTMLGSSIEAIKNLPTWYKQKCSTYIQTLWRGHHTRRIYKIFKEYGILSQLHSWIEVRSYKQDYDLYSPILQAKVTFCYLINSTKPVNEKEIKITRELSSLL